MSQTTATVKPVFGVFAHVDDAGFRTGRGYVVRQGYPDFAWPYSTQEPVRIFKNAAAAQRLAEKLSFPERQS